MTCKPTVQPWAPADFGKATLATLRDWLKGSSGNMEAISEDDSSALACSAASANFAASRTVALFGVPF
jgi:hypothetical protein